MILVEYRKTPTMSIEVRNKKFFGLGRPMLLIVDVVVLVKLYFEPSHIHLTQQQALPHPILDIEQTSVSIFETAGLAKVARRQNLDANRICSHGHRLGSAETSARGRANCHPLVLSANAKTSPELPPNTQVLQPPIESRTSPGYTPWMARDALLVSHDAIPRQT
jgi:hypothetical protein